MSPSLRKPEVLPPEEIKAAISSIVDANFGAEKEQLVPAVARLFGFGSTSSQLRAVIEGSMMEMIAAKKLKIEGNHLALIQNS